MRVLIVDGYAPDDSDRTVVDAAIDALQANHNTVEHLVLHELGFASFMSTAERVAYETDTPLLSEEAKASAEAVKRADALLFCYPTTTFAVPALLKSWLERVLVNGVAFRFDHKNRLRPGLTNVRRLGAITTSPHGRLTTMRARDGGRRTVMWTLRLNCHPVARRTFASLPRSRWVPADVAKRLSRWR